ncbi:MAG: YcxB family protein [Oscillospiraceae bacterium]
MADKKDKYQQLEEEQDGFIEVDKTDNDLLKNPQKEFQGGIETEEYDVLPDIDSHDDIKDKLAQKEAIKVEYSFNGQEVTEGLTIYQAATIYKRNMIYSAILLCVFFVYVVNIIKNPGEVFSIFLAAMCVAVLGFIWILPKMHIKKTAKAADLQELKFAMKIYDNCIQIGEDGGSFIIAYEKEITAIYETPNLYLVCAGKERLFILPKRCLSKEQNQKVLKTFKAAMQDRYIAK